MYPFKSLDVSKLEPTEIHSIYVPGAGIVSAVAFAVEFFYFGLAMTHATFGMVLGFLLQYALLRLRLYYMQRKQGRDAANWQMRISVYSFFLNLAFLTFFLLWTKNSLFLLGFLIAFHFNIFFIVLVSFRNQNKKS
ncbi:MAG: hypothetical protein AAF518_11795 [Spirochaetota bacterium]